jgi:hypothetical protein
MTSGLFLKIYPLFEKRVSNSIIRKITFLTKEEKFETRYEGEKCKILTSTMR